MTKKQKKLKKTKVKRKLKKNNEISKPCVKQGGSLGYCTGTSKEKWYIEYLYYPFHWYVVNPYNSIRYFIKCFIQRRIRGFDDGELWDFDITFKNWWKPRFNRFIKIYGSEYYKPYGTSQKQWEKVISMISWWLNDSDKDYWNSLYGEDKKKYTFNEYMKREQEAIKLLKRHMFDFSI